MLDIKNAKHVFKQFLEEYKNKGDLGFDLKVVHTYHVTENAKKLAQGLNLKQEDVELAELIGLLHDIGRFEELKILSKFDSIGFNHAEYGVKMLFEDDLIRKFIQDSEYDKIIKLAIANHSKLAIDEGLDERTLLHCKIIRDSDKLDNIKEKKEEKIESIFPKMVKSKEEIENSTMSETVYNSIKKLECVKLTDRKTPIDYWTCVLAFIFDLNFSISYKIVKENNYVNYLIDRFDYKISDTKEKMEDTRKILNNYIDKKIKIYNYLS